jgi:hypothetical protein
MGGLSAPYFLLISSDCDSPRTVSGASKVLLVIGHKEFIYMLHVISPVYRV